MHLTNFIETQYRKLKDLTDLNDEFATLYSAIEDDKMREILSTLHYKLTELFKSMNQRLPTSDMGNHFWAEPSRELMRSIEITLGLYNKLKGTQFSFEIDRYYYDLIIKCRNFLKGSGGSTLPPNMEEVELYYQMPIFTPQNIIAITNPITTFSAPLKQIGEGSYAIVYKYWDKFYNRHFVLKRAKKNLTGKELERFRREFEEMKNLSSPYIVNVFCYIQDKNEYIMEYMDFTLYDYITKNNSTLTEGLRRKIVNQLLRAISYIHSKKRLHRDISPKNILVKKYDDDIVLKISDFGLVKTPESSLTSTNTDFKGWFNDPALRTEGFSNYGQQHETYALTLIIYFIITGKINPEKVREIQDEKLRAFIQKGLNADKLQRYQNIDEMNRAFKATAKPT